ncbi:hypothetical protein F4556_006771 [Kitasatospora gansuensis]|uniref:Uncharacterized protein n=1 Tax=Kitasatospora gansuensis TaxID=258050 RepID=A0A7W7SL05_9ACTN|nr:hypothetical protein [Kitasatospora gansuensis]MBB4951236.1 hypothetical protein [Kitasatospora gansuensis]
MLLIEAVLGCRARLPREEEQRAGDRTQSAVSHQTAWAMLHTRFRRWAGDGTFERMLRAAQTRANVVGAIDRFVSVRLCGGRCLVPSLLAGGRAGFLSDAEVCLVLVGAWVPVYRAVGAQLGQEAGTHGLGLLDAHRADGCDREVDGVRVDAAERGAPGRVTTADEVADVVRVGVQAQVRGDDRLGADDLLAMAWGGHSAQFTFIQSCPN